MLLTWQMILDVQSMGFLALISVLGVEKVYHKIWRQKKSVAFGIC